MFWHLAQQKQIENTKNVNTSIKAKLYHSGTNPNYQKVPYSGQHFYFRDKSHIFTVESVNSDIRKYFAAFQRKSKSFFRSLETLQAIMLVYAYNKFRKFKQQFSHVKSAVDLTSFFALLLTWALPTK